MITFSLRPMSLSERLLIAASVSTRVVSWKEAADSQDSVAREALVIPLTSAHPLRLVYQVLLHATATHHTNHVVRSRGALQHLLAHLHTGTDAERTLHAAGNQRCQARTLRQLLVHNLIGTIVRDDREG